MTQKTLQSKKMGFSLIELSIVILVIGILVIGITKGTAIMTKARVGSAKALTSSSPVAIISDLVAWYEPTLDTSFSPANAYDETSLSGGWFDNSPSKSLNASAGGTAPLYIESSINNLPAARFNGTASTLTFDSSSLSQRDYTIFIVEQRRAATTDGAVLLQFGGSDNVLKYSDDTTISDLSATTTDPEASIPAFVSNKFIPRLLAFRLNNNDDERLVYVNGAVGSTAGTGELVSATSSGVIGSDGTDYYNGDISEIIIYNRALKDDEINDIYDYLSKKYDVKVSSI